MLGLYSGQSLAETLLHILYILPAVFIAFSFHEFAHAFVAYRLGDSSQRISGRLTLSPLAHIDWIGLLMIVVFGFGWAKPVRVNPNGFKNRRLGMVLVALAGPLMNFILAFLFCGIYYVCFFNGVTNVPIMTIIYYVYSLNAALMVFNLLPLPPLDGYRIIDALIRIKPRWLYMFERYSVYILMLLLITGFTGRFIGFCQNAVMNFIEGFYDIIVKAAL